MRSRTTAVGVLFATTTAVVWGGQFVVGKSALESVDAAPLSTIRYALAAALWLAVLAVLEGPRSLRLDGRGWRLFWLGSLAAIGGVGEPELERSLAEGQKVSFDIVPDARGAKASNLKPA